MKFNVNFISNINDLALEQSVVQWQDDSSAIKCCICK